jgi:hypothetical protein
MLLPGGAQSMRFFPFPFFRSVFVSCCVFCQSVATCSSETPAAADPFVSLTSFSLWKHELALIRTESRGTSSHFYACWSMLVCSSFTCKISSLYRAPYSSLFSSIRADICMSVYLSVCLPPSNSPC